MPAVVSLNSFKDPNALVGNTKMPDAVDSAGVVVTGYQLTASKDSYSNTVAALAFITCSVLYRNNSLFTQSCVDACVLASADAFKLTSVTTLIVANLGIAISNPGDITIVLAFTLLEPVVTLYRVNAWLPPNRFCWIVCVVAEPCGSSWTLLIVPKVITSPSSIVPAPKVLIVVAPTACTAVL